MTEQEILLDISKKELEFGCYEAKTNGFPLYILVRRDIRDKILTKMGGPFMETRSVIDKKSVIPSAIKSLWQLLLLCLSGRKVSIVFNAFPRVEKIQGIYIEKFTDPIVTQSQLCDSCIIFDQGRAGVHPKPRLNQDNIIYSESIFILAKFFSFFFSFYYYRKYKEEFEKTYLSIEQAFGDVLGKKELYKSLILKLCMICLVKKVLKKISAKAVVGPARDYQTVLFIAAHKLGIKAYELQHGITYGETTMYSGYRDPVSMPDFFLAFGDNNPWDVYGIDKERIINIGWALNDYIKDIPKQEHYNTNDVLVVSDPEITDAIIKATKFLADNNKESIFYFRPHPHEVLSKVHLDIISNTNNIMIQDKNINISVVLQGFNHIIGENSTVLYEALSVNKKVGRLFFDGLHPHYLEETDKDCFWDIRNQEDFKKFLNDNISAKKDKSIYSNFNKDLFCKTIGL